MNVLILSKIHADAIAALRARHDVVVAINPPADRIPSLIADREVVIMRSGVELTSAALEAAPRLAMLLRAGSGVDNVDLDYLARRNIQLVRIPGPGAQSVAELTFAHMLALARNVLPADASMRAGKWLKADMEGRTLTGKVLGVIGLGNIGTRVAQMGAAWGMEPIGCVEVPSPAREAAFAAQGIRLVECDEVFTTADFVSLHVPLTDHNRGLVGHEALASMKPSAYLVNLARGGVVDEDALLEALRNGTIAGAGLDVHVSEGAGQQSPFRDLANVVLTPHLGASTTDSQSEIGRDLVRVIDSWKRDTVSAPAGAILPASAV